MDLFLSQEVLLSKFRSKFNETLRQDQSYHYSESTHNHAHHLLHWFTYKEDRMMQKQNQLFHINDSFSEFQKLNIHAKLEVEVVRERERERVAKWEKEEIFRRK